MSISAIGGVSSFNFYNTSSISNMYQLMRYQYNINSLLSSGNASKVTSYLGSSQAAASSSGVDKTKAFLGAYQSDLTDLEKAADKLNYFKSGNVFTQYTLGSSDEDVAEISVNSLRKQKDFSVTVQNLATDSQPARYSITENGKTTQYTSASNTVQLINADATLTLRGTGTTNIYTGIDEDEIVTAMKDMVTAHNKTMETLSAGKGLGSGIEKQLSRMTGTLANGNIMSMVGLSYDKNGDLKLDEKRLRSALENDFDTTKELIGGQYGIASILGDRAANTLNESVRTIVGTTNTYSTMDLFGQNGRGLYSGNDISTNYMNMMFDFSRNTPYNYSNYYAVGSMLNLLG